MDKEIINEHEIDADFTGHSEKELDKAVDMQPGQWKNVSGNLIFKKNSTDKKKLRK